LGASQKKKGDYGGKKKRRARRRKAKKLILGSWGKETKSREEALIRKITKPERRERLGTVPDGESGRPGLMELDGKGGNEGTKGDWLSKLKPEERGAGRGLEKRETEDRGFLEKVLAVYAKRSGTGVCKGKA